MSDFRDFDLDRTLHDYDYTLRAVYKMNRIMDSAEFESMDAEEIFDYLSKEMEIILFPDYLKRYIYRKTEIDAPFAQVPDSLYQEIISQAFADNRAPYGFRETSAKKNAIIRRWLTQGSVKRSTVFTLGFGLNMPAEDVSDFLTKVLKEEDFDFADPEETILWYCFNKNLPYAKYLKLMDQYEKMTVREYSEKTWSAMSGAPKMFLGSAQNLQQYLMMLKDKDLSEKKQETALGEFKKLYDQCREVVAEMHNQDVEFVDGGTRLTPEEVTPADIEKELCCGIPVNGKGNLEVMTRSCFSSMFEQKRMSRQRIGTILSRQHRVERFDLITLLFFIYAQTVEPDWPAERYMQYIDKINEILHRCQMADIYPVNPYEAFVLMCLVTDNPLDVYAEIWEKSYEE